MSARLWDARLRLTMHSRKDLADSINRSSIEVERAVKGKTATASQSLGGRAAAEEEGLCMSQLWDAESAERYL